MKIPFKSYQLMEAIIECVEELDGSGIPLHPDLTQFYGKLYGQVFMNKQIQKTKDEYKKCGNSWIATGDPSYYLYEDFGSVDSPFYRVIQRG